jgi:2-(3-amino-3-carboxypropyl)histidine synthase
VLSSEGYAHEQLHANRRAAIAAAAGARTFGVVLGTLGRQGNPHVVDRVCALLASRGRAHLVVLLSEIAPDKLAAFRGVDAWVQVAPRLLPRHSRCL